MSSYRARSGYYFRDSFAFLMTLQSKTYIQVNRRFFHNQKYSADPKLSTLTRDIKQTIIKEVMASTTKHII